MVREEEEEEGVEADLDRALEVVRVLPVEPGEEQESKPA